MTKRRVILYLVLPLVALFAGGEVFSRFGLGLGDPPLSMADLELEYLFQPNQRCSRFGNTITYNQYSMRGTPDFPLKKPVSEFRVLLLGDSVVNGGTLTDDAQLASTILANELRVGLAQPAIVANVSAGSWGPQNLLVYMRRFGHFDADFMVIVLSSHDSWDTMTFSPTVGVSPSFPSTRPSLALEEAVTRYVLPRIGWSTVGSSNEAPQTMPATDERVTASLSALNELVASAAQGGLGVLLVLHPTQTELRTTANPLRLRMADVARNAGAEVLDLYEPFLAIENSPSLYRPDDDIHLSAAGQAELARRILPALLSMKERKARVSPSGAERR